jgi:hypothetical protein
MTALKEIKELNTIETNICYLDRIEIFLTKIINSVKNAQSISFVENDLYTDFETVKLNLDKALQHSNEKINKYKDEINTRIVTSEKKYAQEIQDINVRSFNESSNSNKLTEELEKLQKTKERQVIELNDITCKYDELNINYRNEVIKEEIAFECEKKIHLRNFYLLLSFIIILIFVYFIK